MSNVTINRPSSTTPQAGAGAVEDQITKGTAEAEAKKDKSAPGKVPQKNDAEAKKAAADEVDAKQLKSGQQLFALDAVAKTPEQALAVIAMLGGAEPQSTDAAAPKEVASAKVAFEALADKIDPNKAPDADAVAKPFQVDAADTGITLANAPALHTPDSVALTGALRFLAGNDKLPQANPRVLERVELFKAYQKVMEAADAKGEAAASALQQRVAELPNAFKKAIEQAAPQIATAYKQWLGTKSEFEKKLEQKKITDADIIHGELPVIPGPMVLQLENAVGVIHKGALEALKDLQAGKEPKIKLSPALLAKIKVNGRTQPEKEDKTQKSGTDFSAPTPLHFGSGLSGGFMAMLANGDIETLLSIVMMSCEKTESDMLRDLMAEMALKNEQKKALREAKTKMKEDSTRLDAQMRNEYNELRASGDIHPTITFDDFKAWRELQWGNVEVSVTGGVSYGGAALGPLPPLPPHFKTGNVAPPTTGPNVNPQTAEAYGIPPQLQEVLVKMYNALPADKKPADFVSFLTGTLGLVTPTSKNDIKDNLAKVKQALEAAKTTEAGPVQDPNACQPGGALYNAVNKLMELQILQAMGCHIDFEVQQAQEALNAELAKGQPETNPPFATQFQSMLIQLKDKASAGFEAMAKKASNFWENGPGGPGGPGKDPSKWKAYNANWNGDSSESDFLGGESGEWNESFTAGMGWVSKTQYDEESVQVADGGDPDGYSEPIKVEWTGDGMVGHGHYVSYNDSDESSDFKVTYPTGNEWVKSLEAVMKETGQKLPPNGAKGDWWSGAASTAIGIINGITGYALTGAPAGSGASVPSPDEYAAMAGTVQSYIDKMGNPKSDFSKWIYDKDFDGSKTADQQKKAAQEYEKQKQKYKDDNAGALRMDQHGTLAQFDVAIQQVDDKLASLSEMSEMDSLRLQTLMDRRSKLIETLSNMLKKISQTDSTITGNQK